ncbi:hypothetical protein DA803_02920 [[Mycoplasma] phocae]|uniref:Lipoprotein n=1 Tax=[Mycoplasma] phocae TaxID=142651 RepID=A0A2Z5IRD0_9BACT|nr:variable surface lipoprotein [[Mycoplasma] phocae]AXE61021.1 hypothetical protein DA803_02920 [[Mycoplasma] phocae]
MKKSIKILISLGTFASVITLPLIAASCGNSKGKDMDGKTEDKDKGKDKKEPDMDKKGPTTAELQEKLNKATFTYNSEFTNVNNFAIDKISISETDFTIQKDSAKSNFINYKDKGVLVQLTTLNKNREFLVYIKFMLSNTNKTVGTVITKQEFDKQKELNDKIKAVKFKYDEKIEKNKMFDFKKLTIVGIDGFSIDETKSTYYLTEIFLYAKVTIKNSDVQAEYYVKLEFNKNKPESINVQAQEFDNGIKGINIQKREILGILNSSGAPEDEKAKLREKINAALSLRELAKLREEITNSRIKYNLLDLIKGLESKNKNKYDEFVNLINKSKNENDLSPIYQYFIAEKFKILDFAKENDDKTKIINAKTFDELYKLEEEIKKKMSNTMKPTS